MNEVQLITIHVATCVVPFRDISGSHVYRPQERSTHTSERFCDELAVVFLLRMVVHLVTVRLESHRWISLAEVMCNFFV